MPEKRDSGATISASGTSTARHAAIAASAFMTLCAPGTGISNIVSSTRKRLDCGLERDLFAAHICARAQAEAQAPAGERIEILVVAHDQRLARAGPQGGEHRRHLVHLLVVALEVEDHADRRRIAHQRAVALVRLDHEKIGACRQRHCPVRPSACSSGKSPPVMTEGSRPAPAQDLEHHAGDRRLAAGARHGDRAAPRPRNARASPNDARSERRSPWPRRSPAPAPRPPSRPRAPRNRSPTPLPSCGNTSMPSASNCARKRCPFAVIEGAVAAAHAAAGHRLKLGDGAHAGAAEPRIVKAPAAVGIGDRARRQAGR